MDKIFVISISITLLFFIIKIFELKYLKKEKKAMKEVIRDSFIVLLASSIITYIFVQFETSITDFFCVITNDKKAILNETAIFTDEPDF